jgi:hypothetical protein
MHAPALITVRCLHELRVGRGERLEADDAAAIAHGPQVLAKLIGVGADVKDEIDPEALEPLLELEHRVHSRDQSMKVVAGPMEQLPHELL